MGGGLIEVSKIIRVIGNPPLDYLFQVRSEAKKKRLRGYQHMLMNPRARLDVGCYGFSHRIVSEWILAALREADGVKF